MQDDRTHKTNPLSTGPIKLSPLKRTLLAWKWWQYYNLAGARVSAVFWQICFIFFKYCVSPQTCWLHHRLAGAREDINIANTSHPIVVFQYDSSRGSSKMKLWWFCPPGLQSFLMKIYNLHINKTWSNPS